jgi:tRNA-dihydrouridine synthase
MQAQDQAINIAAPTPAIERATANTAHFSDHSALASERAAQRAAQAKELAERLSLGEPLSKNERKRLHKFEHEDERKENRRREKQRRKLVRAAQASAQSEATVFPLATAIPAQPDATPLSLLPAAARHARAWEFWRRIGSPTRILAPMVNQSELAFRLLARRHGAQLTYTPMLNSTQFSVRAGPESPTATISRSARCDQPSGLTCTLLLGAGVPLSAPFQMSQTYRQEHFDAHVEDRPLVVQFCGDDAATLIAAAKHVEGKCDAIELNCGCPQVRDWPALSVQGRRRLRTRARLPVSLAHSCPLSFPAECPRHPAMPRPLRACRRRSPPAHLCPDAPAPLLPQAIAKRGHYGAFLLDEPDLIVSIVEQLTRNVSTPVMVKMRVVKPRAEGQVGADTEAPNGGDCGADGCAGDGDGRGLAALDSEAVAAGGGSSDGSAPNAAADSEGQGASFETLSATNADASDVAAALRADEEARFYESTMRLALRLQAAGAAVLTLHGRTKEQKTRVECDWKAIAALKRVRAQPSSSAAHTGTGPLARGARLAQKHHQLPASLRAHRSQTFLAYAGAVHPSGGQRRRREL